MALGPLADALDRIPVIRRDLVPLEGRGEYGEPSAAGLRRHADLATQLRVVDLARGQRRDEPREATELLPVINVGKCPCIPLDVGAQIGPVEIVDPIRL